MNRKPTERESVLDERRLQRMADAAAAFSFWACAPIDCMHRVELADWRVTQIVDGSRHLVGISLTEGRTGRVSSRIVVLDAAQSLAKTVSGRVYELHGPPGRSQDSAYAWHRWLEPLGSPPWLDVTAAVLAELHRRPPP
jgi:hypothetical protein